MRQRHRSARGAWSTRTQSVYSANGPWTTAASRTRARRPSHRRPNGSRHGRTRTQCWPAATSSFTDASSVGRRQCRSKDLRATERKRVISGCQRDQGKYNSRLADPDPRTSREASLQRRLDGARRTTTDGLIHLDGLTDCNGLRRTTTGCGGRRLADPDADYDGLIRVDDGLQRTVTDYVIWEAGEGAGPRVIYNTQEARAAEPRERASHPRPNNCTVGAPWTLTVSSTVRVPGS